MSMGLANHKLSPVEKRHEPLGNADGSINLSNIAINKDNKRFWIEDEAVANELSPVKKCHKPFENAIDFIDLSSFVINWRF